MSGDARNPGETFIGVGPSSEEMHGSALNPKVARALQPPLEGRLQGCRDGLARG